MEMTPATPLFCLFIERVVYAVGAVGVTSSGGFFFLRIMKAMDPTAIAMTPATKT